MVGWEIQRIIISNNNMMLINLHMDSPGLGPVRTIPPTARDSVWLGSGNRISDENSRCLNYT